MIFAGGLPAIMVSALNADTGLRDADPFFYAFLAAFSLP